MLTLPKNDSGKKRFLPGLQCCPRNSSAGNCRVIHPLIFWKMFLELLIAILMGLATPDYKSTMNADDTVVTTTSDDGDTEPGGEDDSGDTGHIPPKPPTGG